MEETGLTLYEFYIQLRPDVSKPSLAEAVKQCDIEHKIIPNEKIMQKMEFAMYR